MGRLALLGLLAAACTGAEPPVDPDAGLGSRQFGEPCSATEDCMSGLCIAVASGRAVCTRLCADDTGCPTDGAWACVSPIDFESRVCGCVADSELEICGDGWDNDCDGTADDCRICDGRAVPEDDPLHCGRCGNACRTDQECLSGSCECAVVGDVDCGDACADLSNDPSNCGACGDACPTAQVCRDGTCDCSDSSAADYCPGVGCVDLSTNATHCGSCDNACPTGRECTAGACDCSTPGLSDCGAAGCVNLTNDSDNCGACGTAYASGEVCSGSACGCPASTPDRCATSCVDFESESTNCGGCGIVCPGATRCTAGTCTCISGLTPTLCGDTCVDLSRSTMNCGGCGTTCTAGESCTGGVCTCASSLYCGGTCVSASDTTNCGTCGVTCGAAQLCSGGACVCASSALTACGTACFDVRSDALNCGACGNVCRSTEVCVSGTCACPSGTAWCASAGACIDTSSSTAHCGACDNACEATEICSAGTCRCSATTELFCVSEGMCVDVRSNVAHCGACDASCRPTEICSFGSCRCPTSRQAFCSSAGACVDTYSNAAHCGGCDAACPAGTDCVARSCQCMDTSLDLCGGSCVDLQTDTAHCGTCGASCAGTQTCSAGICTCPTTPGTIYRVTNTTGQEEERIDVASSGSRVGVVWYERPLSGSARLLFELRNPDGTLVAGTTQQLDTGIVNIDPQIVWNGSTFVVLWVEVPASSRRLMIRHITTSGVAMPPIDVTAAAGTPTIHSNIRDFQYSPVSGYALIADTQFQYLGPSATSPAPIQSMATGRRCVALHPSLSGDWGVYAERSGTDELIVYNADGSLTSLPVSVSDAGVLSDHWRIALSHDGTTWLSVHAAQIGSSPQIDGVILRRGPALADSYVVESRVHPIGVPGLTFPAVELAVSGTEVLVGFAEYVTSGADATYRVARWATDAPGPREIGRPTTIVSTPTVYPFDKSGLCLGDADTGTFVWRDSRWSLGEVYATSFDIGGCP